jgi:hypothetical protein
MNFGSTKTSGFISRTLGINAGAVEQHEVLQPELERWSMRAVTQTNLLLVPGDVNGINQDLTHYLRNRIAASLRSIRVRTASICRLKNSRLAAVAGVKSQFQPTPTARASSS